MFLELLVLSMQLINRSKDLWKILIFFSFYPARKDIGKLLQWEVSDLIKKVDINTLDGAKC